MRRCVLLLTCLTLFGCGKFVAPGGTTEGTLPSGDIQLSYALDLPLGTGPFPALVLAHGSGPKTKDVRSEWSRELTARGIAVLRYDKRGAGDSGGVYQDWGAANSDTMVPLLAGDLAAAVDFLRKQPKIDPDRVGVIGPSQAGWLIPAAAAMNPNIRFACVKSGSAVSVGMNTRYEQLTAEDNGIEEATSLLKAFQGVAGYDPADDLETLNIPIIWMLGGQDRQVPPLPSKRVLEDLAARHGRPIKVVFVPQGDHGMEPDWDAFFSWFDAIPLSVSPAAGP